MYVKVYEYHIQKARIADFQAYHQLSKSLYEKYLPVEMILLKKEDTETAWMEMNIFASKGQFEKNSPLIEADPGHEELFRRFSDCLVPGTLLEESGYTVFSGPSFPFRF